MLEQFYDSSFSSNVENIPLIPSSTISQETLIGEGGYGKVYLGRWQGIDVAIKQLHLKILPSDLVAHLEHEATLMASCQFPHIVRLYGIINHYRLKPIV